MVRLHIEIKQLPHLPKRAVQLREKVTLPLHFTWYRATDEEKFVIVEKAIWTYSQPNPDDIWFQICVHADPVSEVQEYFGMPAFSLAGQFRLTWSQNLFIWDIE